MLFAVLGCGGLVGEVLPNVTELLLFRRCLYAMLFCREWFALPGALPVSRWLPLVMDVVKEVVLDEVVAVADDDETPVSGEESLSDR